MKTVPELLREGAALFEERNADHGDAYKRFGALMIAIFPRGLPAMHTAEDWSRFGVFFHIVNKTVRYAHSLGRGGHLDGARDIKVYGAMLEEITTEGKVGVRAGVGRAETATPGGLGGVRAGWDGVPGLPEAVALLRAAEALPAGSMTGPQRLAIRNALGSLSETDS